MVSALSDKSLPADEERSWIAAARKGDKQAFSALVSRYQERAVRTAYSFLGNWEEAADQAQEAFVKAYFHLKRFKGESAFFTWFYRILINQCKDCLRRKKNRLGFSLSNQAEKEDEGERSTLEEIAGPFDTARGALDAELETEILKAKSELPPRQQMIFTLRYFEDKPLQEIADILNLSLGAVKANLWQALEKMKKYLRVYVTDAGGGS